MGGSDEGGVVVSDVGSTYVSKYPLSPCIKLDRYYIVVNSLLHKGDYVSAHTNMAAAHTSRSCQPKDEKSMVGMKSIVKYSVE